MYPESSESGAPADYGGGYDNKIGTHLEGLIPVVLIVIIAFFLAIQFDVVDSSTPIIGIVADVFNAGNTQSDMLIIGATSRQVIDILNENRDLIDYDLRTTNSLERNPEAIIANYDIIMLDQSEEANKEVSRKLGEALEKYVKGGGSFILVKDSGIRRPDTYDVIGWKNTFGDIVPVECDRVIDGRPTCTNKQVLRGKLFRQDENHPIMSGIEEYPPLPLETQVFESFDVSIDGKEIAYIQDSGQDGRNVTGIVEKNLVIGKSIYFNYNPGLTKGIFETTLKYLG